MSQNKSKLHHQHFIKSISGGSRKLSATLSSAVLSALVLMSGAHAANFGKLTVLSSLGQPLRAEIELTSVAKDEEGQLTAKLASAEVYKQAGIEFNASLMTLQFAIDQRGTRKFVRVTSSQPINEPVVDVLMELGGTKTRVVREYTLMLDPADSRTPQSAQLAPTMHAGQAAAKPAKAARQAAAIVSSPTAAPSVPNSIESSAISAVIPAGARNDRTSTPFVPEKTEQVAKSAVKAVNKVAKTVVEKDNEPTSGKATGNYHVKKGDTLASIAGQNLSGSISLDQMLVAMYRSNQQAFAGNNMNRLRSGQVLSIPDAESAQAISKSEARGVILAQSQDFRNYRNTLAGQVASSAGSKSAESKQSGGGKITARVEEKANSTDDAQDKLKLSRSGAANAPNAAIEAKLAAANEDKIAHERAAAEAELKIKALEKNVNDLQKVLEVKNKNLEDLQKQANAIKPAAPVSAPVASTVSAAVTSAVPSMTAALPTAPAAASVTATSATSIGALATDIAASTPAAVASVASTPVIVPIVAKPKAAPVPVQTAAPAGFFSGITDSPLLLPAAGVLALLLGGLGISRIRRKQQQQAFLNTNGDPTTNSDLKTNSLFGSTGGQNVDTKNSIFNSNFVPSVSHLDTNVDPVAEADVYIAYGRDAQAEEILKEALRLQPNRNAIRVKLLEIYATRKDVRAFEGLSAELYSLTHGEGEEWQQAAVLGASIDASNPLYSGTNLLGVASAPSAMQAAQVTAAARAVAPAMGIDSTFAAHVDASPISNEALDLPVLTNYEPATLPMHHDMNLNVDLDTHLDHVDNSRPATNQDTLLAAPTAIIPEANKAMFADLDFELDSTPSTTAAAISAHKIPLHAEAANAGLDFGNTAFPNYVGMPYKYEPLQTNSSSGAVAQHKVDVAAPLHAELKMSDLNLDLDPAHHQASTLDLPHADVKVEPTISHSATTNAEMATKLDLAVAYQEIGDTEGARELLEEVVKGGNAEQLESAKALLSKLA